MRAEILVSQPIFWDLYKDNSGPVIGQLLPGVSTRIENCILTEDRIFIFTFGLGASVFSVTKYNIEVIVVFWYMPPFIEIELTPHIERNRATSNSANAASM
jgi:hypothetical protein